MPRIGVFNLNVTLLHSTELFLLVASLSRASLSLRCGVDEDRALMLTPREIMFKLLSIEEDVESDTETNLHEKPWEGEHAHLSLQ